LDSIWEHGRTRHDQEVLGMMGYARRDYGLIGKATEELNSGSSRKDAATEAFHWHFRHVSVA
jgi:hypothetical protein